MTISEMAEKTNMSADALRYYERIGLLPSVPRNAAGVRVYDEYFVQWIDFIKKLKASGMSLESIIDYIQLAKMGDATYQKRKDMLAESKKMMLEKIHSLQSVVELVEYQLQNYYEQVQAETDFLLHNRFTAKSLAG